MEVQTLREGLWRWTAPHPDWRPEKGGKGGWEEMVGCVYYEADDAVVLFDPLAPPAGTDADRFWTALDRDVARSGRPVAILLGNYYHERSAAAVQSRYGKNAEVWAPVTAAGKTTCQVTRTFKEGDALPGGISVYAIPSLDDSDSEVVFFLPQHGALVFADAVLGAGDGKVRVAPQSWAPKSEDGARRYREEFRTSLRRLLDLPVEMLLVSHGDPVVSNGHRVLAEALDAKAWGED